MQEAHRRVGKLTEQNAKLHTQLVKEINARCKVEATNSGLRREVKELKKTIRGLIQEVDHYQQRQQQQQQRCATMKEYQRIYGKGHNNDGLAALEQQRQLKQEARGDDRVEERVTVRRVDSSMTNYNNNDNNDGECRKVGNSRTKKRKKTKTKKRHHHNDYYEDGDDTDDIGGAVGSWRVSPSPSLMHG